jgi:hypothetical protein
MVPDHSPLAFAWRTILYLEKTPHQAGHRPSHIGRRWGRARGYGPRHGLARPPAPYNRILPPGLAERQDT